MGYGCFMKRLYYNCFRFHLFFGLSCLRPNCSLKLATYSVLIRPTVCILYIYIWVMYVITAPNLLCSNSQKAVFVPCGIERVEQDMAGLGFSVCEAAV